MPMAEVKATAKASWPHKAVGPADGADGGRKVGPTLAAGPGDRPFLLP